MPLPRWGEIRQFCLRQGYEERRTDHFRYHKVLSDNSLSGTMVSFGKDGVILKPDLWLRVWKRQLRLASEEDFWSGLSGGPVEYNVPPHQKPPSLCLITWCSSSRRSAATPSPRSGQPAAKRPSEC